jgi:hypothetical protein
MTSDDAVRHVRNLIDNSGLLLEMTVKEAMAKHGAVIRSSYFTDVDEDKVRSADVVASFHASSRGGHVHVVYVVECKKAADSDWVLSVEDNPFRGKLGILPSLPSHGTLMAEVGDVRHVHHSPLLWIPHHRVAGTLRDVKAKADERKTRSSGSQTYHALLQVLAASEGLKEFDFGLAPSVTVVVPVIVTQARLWSAQLDAASELAIAPVERILLASRVRTDQPVTSVWVVQAGHIDAFAADARKGVDRLVLEPRRAG